MLKLIHLELSEANVLVSQWHRHHKPVVGHRFSLGCLDDNKLCGAAIVGRSVSRNTDQKMVLEILRLVTDGTYNVCSFLYGACARAGKTLGYVRIQTYILDCELGTSLKASGYSFIHITQGGNWNSRQKQNRRIDQPLGPKQLWGKIL